MQRFIHTATLLLAMGLALVVGTILAIADVAEVHVAPLAIPAVVEVAVTPSTTEVSADQNAVWTWIVTVDTNDWPLLAAVRKAACGDEAIALRYRVSVTGSERPHVSLPVKDSCADAGSAAIVLAAQGRTTYSVQVWQAATASPRLEPLPALQLVLRSDSGRTITVPLDRDRTAATFP